MADGYTAKEIEEGFAHLKTWPDPFRAVWERRKKAEFRRDDRDPRFEVGQNIYLEEWIPDDANDPRTGRFTGRNVLVTITHVVRGGRFGIPEGYCMFSFAPLQFFPDEGPGANGETMTA